MIRMWDFLSTQVGQTLIFHCGVQCYGNAVVLLPCSLVLLLTFSSLQYLLLPVLSIRCIKVADRWAIAPPCESPYAPSPSKVFPATLRLTLSSIQSNQVLCPAIHLFDPLYMFTWRMPRTQLRLHKSQSGASHFLPACKCMM